MEKLSAWAEICETGLEIHPGLKLKLKFTISLKFAFALKFQPEQKSELGHAQCDCGFGETRWRSLTFPCDFKFQPGLKLVM